MLTISQLKELFSEYSFTPLKRFGENYLIDANVKDKIVREAGVCSKDTVLEIGPGFGALTFDIASSGAKVFAVDKDRKAYSILKDMTEDGFPNLKLFNEDILKFDIGKNIGSKSIKVVGNLPYYVTTPIVEYLIDNRAVIESALIVVQHEVARRFLAHPGSEDYGSISCFVQYYTKPSYIHTIKRTSFYPKPEVDSSLVRFDFLKKPAVKVRDEELLFRIIRGSFNQRRKTIANSLSRAEVLGTPKDTLALILDKAGVDPSLRPEELSLETFAKICNSCS